MIGNKYLQNFYEYPDEDTGLNQLLEFLKFKDLEFIDNIVNNAVDLNLCTEQEIIFLTKASAIIDYYFQLYNIKVPNWLRDERLSFEKPYYHPKRLSDFEKFKLFYTNPSPFRARNTYFDLESLKRV